MADEGIHFNADFSQLVNEVVKATKGLDGFDIKAENVTEIVTRLAKGTDLLTVTLTALGPAGEVITLVLQQMDEAMAATNIQADAVAGGFEVVHKSLKQFNSQTVDTKKADDLRAIAEAARSAIISDVGVNNPVTQTNAFNNQLEAITKAALASKAPLEDLQKLVGASADKLAEAEGKTRGFADALFKATQIANQTKIPEFASQVQQSQAIPNGLTTAQQAALTESTREVGDAAAKAGLDTATFNSILNQSSDTLAKNVGITFEVSQAVINYREQLNKLTAQQKEQASETEKSNAVNAATSFAKKTFFGEGQLTGTNEEITKQTTALAAFSRAVESAGLSEQEATKTVKNFTEGIVNEEIALAGVNKALAQIQASTRQGGAAQRAANVEDEKRLQIAQQLAVAQQSISTIRLQLPIPDGAPTDAVNAYTVSLSRLQAQISKSNLSAEQVKAVFSSTLSGSGQIFEGEAGKIQSSINNVVTGYEKLIKATKDLGDETDKGETAIQAFFSRVGSQVTTILINQIFHAFTAGLESARQFSQIVVESAAITQDVGGSYDKFRGQILGISNAFGIARNEVAAGFFQALKHQIGDADESARFAAEAAAFAVVTKASFVDSVQLGTAALNSFSLKVGDSHRVFSLLFEAIKSGRLSTQELSTTLGTLGVIAHEAGVSIEETTAALSSLTHSGVNALQSQTFLRNLFKELIKPTEAMKDLLHTYGFETGKAAVETLGLAGFLNLLQTTADGNVATTGKLVANLRGLQAALGLTGDKFDVFVHALNKGKNAQEDFAKGADVTFKSSAQAFTEFQNQLINQTALISDTIINVVGSIIRQFDNTKDAVRLLRDVFISFTVVAFVANLELVGVALVAVTAKVSALTASLLTNPITLLAVAVGAFVFAVEHAVSVTQNAADEGKRVLEEGEKAIIAFHQRIADAFKKQTDLEIANTNLAVSNIQKIYHHLNDQLVEDFTLTNHKLKNLIDLDVKHRTEAINELKSLSQKAETEITNLIKDEAAGRLKIEDTIFEEHVRDLTLVGQISERQIRAQDLIKAAIADNVVAKKQAVAGEIDASIKTEQISKREFEDASKQLDKIAQATLKVKDLSKGYTSAIAEFLKREFELEVKLINDSEKRVLESFKRVKDAVKDVFDKTGDSSGESGKFLKDYTKQLTTFLNELRATQGRIRISTRGAVEIDPDLRSVLEAVDPKTIRRLRIAIQVGDQESLKRILGDMELIKKKQDEVGKARVANEQEIKAQIEANAERKNLNFENERKFLKESLDFAVKSEAQGFKGGVTVRREMASIEERILQSYKDEASVIGVKKDREDAFFKTIVSQFNIEKQQRDLMQDQLKAQQGLEASLKASSEELLKQKQLREDELASVKALFQTFDSIKPDKQDTPAQLAEKSAQAAKLAKEIQNGTSTLKFQDPKLLFDILEQVNAKRDELDKIFRTKQLANDLESTRVRLTEQEQLRIEAENKIRGKLAQIQNERNSLPARINAAEDELATAQQRLGIEEKIHEFILADPEHLKQRQDTVDVAKKNLSVLESQNVELNIQERHLKTIEKQLKTGAFDEHTASAISNLLKSKDAGQLLEEHVGSAMRALQAQAEGVGIELFKAFENVNTLNAVEKLKNSINGLKEAINALGDAGEFQIDFKRIQNPAPLQRNFGGIVDGPNGIDAIPTMLTKGEYVVDSNNSSKFFSQLRQISSGKAPTTTNSAVNFGGVSINLHGSGNSKVDALTVVSEIKRLKARGLVDL